MSARHKLAVLQAVSVRVILSSPTGETLVAQRPSQDTQGEAQIWLQTDSRPSVVSLTPSRSNQPRAQASAAPVIAWLLWFQSYGSRVQSTEANYPPKSTCALQ
ncbi:hypothetical protein BCV70DRAFT_205035 [Testicularia cyperi]|uniref:Uncharacterized protein n=1 Tax=Testicularia cyperi TaxID=1882483 RepID=A0A317XYE3_9BASI|nr:hypothetical protein BCV70DRAFT_205035 [Testicularia cyperi]